MGYLNSNWKELNREEMKEVFAGESCTVTVTCPSGRWISCTSASGQCYSEGDGTIHGYINCNTGQTQAGCWMYEPQEA